MGMSAILSLHYLLAFFSILFNVLLIVIIAKRTAPSFRSYAILILEECSFELFSALSNLLSMQRSPCISRLIPIPGTTIFASMGVCSRVSASFCYFFHTMTVCGYVCTVFITSIQLVFRAHLLEQTTPSFIEFWIIPIAAVVFGLHVNVWYHQTEEATLKPIVEGVFPEFVERRLPINGHDSLSLHVLAVNSLYAIE
ncbi:hypothetical protein PFISCL1PPCAC_14230 [Pristionchus fissidentatus]|uniref:G protein-coupled receptor n=1 Tax=Pristionchus fissidentatus TaxID=1538716 RepID=A0AAV5VX17_9BILA|nr:hypothetical protein PFISCL1PPCAC_14230 [Pristionchus fissidentatus]